MLRGNGGADPSEPTEKKKKKKKKRTNKIYILKMFGLLGGVNEESRARAKPFAWRPRHGRSGLNAARPAILRQQNRFERRRRRCPPSYGRVSSHPGHPLYCQTHVVSFAPAAHSTSDDRQIVRLKSQTNKITAKANDRVQMKD